MNNDDKVRLDIPEYHKYSTGKNFLQTLYGKNAIYDKYVYRREIKFFNLCLLLNLCLNLASEFLERHLHIPRYITIVLALMFIPCGFIPLWRTTARIAAEREKLLEHQRRVAEEYLFKEGIEKEKSGMFM